jgi:hypothetical protein
MPAKTSQAQVERFLLPKDNGEYDNDEVKWIINAYLTQAPPLGLDPLLPIAQMCHETGYLSSKWASRPYCNPAGIGVTGEPNKGVSFGSWHNSIPAHLGRLIAYSTKPTERSPLQAAAVQFALKYRSLPAELQGTVTNLLGLQGKWASDPTYATKLATMANNILKA